ncbi:MAG: large conductance mechanosensitive channel protein MscL [Ilumatobacteraceae bacterium]
MKNFLKEFKSFIATGNMIELAVAVILGGVVKQVIDSFIANVANPIVGAIFGKPNLDGSLRWTLRHGDAPDGSEDSVLAVGAVLTTVISLVLTGLVLFVIVKAFNKMKKKSVAEEAPAGPTEVELLTEIRDALKARG